jgi:hypothetical protein
MTEELHAFDAAVRSAEARAVFMAFLQKKAS